MPNEQLRGLLHLPAFHEHCCFGLPAGSSLLLTIAQQLLRIFAVRLALAQVHLDEALNHEWIEHGHLGPGRY